MTQPLHSCLTKATIEEGDDIRRSENWLMSRRARLKVMPDALVCGDWTIPYASIDDAVLFRTRNLFIPCYVLRVKADGKIYQFGLNPGRYWSGELPFSVRRERMRLRYSPYSIAVRLALVSSIIYWAWTRFGN